MADTYVDTDIDTNFALGDAVVITRYYEGETATIEAYPDGSIFREGRYRVRAHTSGRYFYLPPEWLAPTEARVVETLHAPGTAGV